MVHGAHAWLGFRPGLSCRMPPKLLPYRPYYFNHLMAIQMCGGGDNVAFGPRKPGRCGRFQEGGRAWCAAAWHAVHVLPT